MTKTKLALYTPLILVGLNSIKLCIFVDYYVALNILLVFLSKHFFIAHEHYADQYYNLTKIHQETVHLISSVNTFTLVFYLLTPAEINSANDDVLVQVIKINKQIE